MSTAPKFAAIGFDSFPWHATGEDLFDRRGNCLLVGGQPLGYDQHERAAIATLAASARELLAAAKQAEKLIRNGGTVPIKGETWIALTAAIAKAEGRP